MESDVVEQWRAVDGWPYEVSSSGRVRRVGGRLIAAVLSRYGYLTASLWARPRRWNPFVHKLVAGAFLGPCPDGFGVNHRDGKKTNNSVQNLEYVTPAENSAHAKAMGLLARGERNGFSRLTESLVREIRQRVNAGESRRSIAKAMGFGRNTINRVASGETWGHVA